MLHILSMTIYLHSTRPFLTWVSEFFFSWLRQNKPNRGPSKSHHHSIYFGPWLSIHSLAEKLPSSFGPWAHQVIRSLAPSYVEKNKLSFPSLHLPRWLTTKWRSSLINFWMHHFLSAKWPSPSKNPISYRRWPHPSGWLASTNLAESSAEYGQGCR